MGLLLVAVLVLAQLAAPASAPAQVAITVNTTNDEFGTGGGCSLREAVQSLNINAPFSGCPGSASADVVQVPAGVYDLTLNGADDINAVGDIDIASGNIEIRGTGPVTVDGSSGGDRVFHVHGSVAGVLIQTMNIQGGSTGFTGGGIENNGGLTLRWATLTGNSAGGGGGLATINTGATTVHDSTITGNTALGDGGGIYNGGAGTTAVNNGTIAENTADLDNNGGDGGGIANAGTSVTMANTIVAGNFDGSGQRKECHGTLTSGGHNALGSVGECPFAPSTGDLTNTPVPLAPLADNGNPFAAESFSLTRIPLEGSAAINAGHPGTGPGDSCGTFDQRGFTRPIDGVCDIGAVDRIPAQTIPAGGSCSLRNAIEAANWNVPVGGCNGGGDVHDTIPLAPGTHPITGGDMDIVAPRVTISASPPGGATIDQQGFSNETLLQVHPGADATVTGVDLIHGDVTGNGGAIQNLGSLTLTDGTIRDNIAQSGGGIHSSGTLQLSRMTMSGNRATDDGGAIWLEGPGSATLTNVTISGNRANNDGGGIRVESGASASFNANTITANTANFDNFGPGGGGGIWSSSSGNTIANTILAGNIDSTAGGGTPGPECAGPAVGSAGFNLVGSLAECTFVSSDGDQTGVTGFTLGPLAANGGPTQTHALPTGNLAINTGYPGTGSGVPCPSTDQRGTARPQGGRCDIGAFEVVPASIPSTPVTTTPAAPTTKKKCKKGRVRKKGRCVKKKKRN